MYKLEYFYYVIEISKSGSISQAAQNLYISQPYLSLILKELEDIVGFKIFRRTNRGVIPTDAGDSFIKYAYKIVSLIGELDELKNIYSANDLNFSVVSMPSYTVLDLFNSFREIAYNKFKTSKISYLEAPNTYIIENVLKGINDIGIMYTISTSHDIKIKKIENLSLNYLPLLKEPLSIIVSKYSKLYHRKQVRISELRELDFLVEDIKLFDNKPPIENNPLPDLFKKKHNITFNNNRSMLYYLTKRNDCFSIGQKSLNLTNPLVEMDSLRYIPIEDLNIYSTIGYVTSESRELSPISLFFINFIEEYFKKINESIDNITLKI